MAAALVVAGGVCDPPKSQRFDDRMHVRNVEPGQDQVLLPSLA
jgi:hypothetical protein